MSDNSAQDIAAIGVRLVDEAYLVWFAAERDCDEALQAWFRSGSGQRQATYYAYLAALDREMAAAYDLQRLSELAAPCADLLSPQDEGVLE
jgi:hypothetical protein